MTSSPFHPLADPAHGLKEVAGPQKVMGMAACATNFKGEWVEVIFNTSEPAACCSELSGSGIELSVGGILFVSAM